LVSYTYETEYGSAPFSADLDCTPFIQPYTRNCDCAECESIFPVSLTGVVFRPSTHLFYLDTNGNGVWNGASVNRQYNFGLSGDLPVSGDRNNDGKSEIGVFRNSTHLFYLDYNGNGVWNGSVVDRQYNFGITGDKPITGDGD
jgi:hypothetical protein